ncbi:thioredoxin family protein [Bacteroidota bacterium]
MNLDALLAGSKQEVFTIEALQNNKFVLVEFFASWNGASHIMTPVIKELKQQFNGELKVLKVDIENDSEIAKELNVDRTPLFQVYYKGKLIDQVEGIISKKVFLNKIKILLRNYN